ncbi:hypothetical protein [Thalassomonas actiniarum]|uniref:Photosynthesis system II assembly factor Ycf48/Hcf136-like domain-containing protein n=1 Tax=Thalassomonas actiniarum TaxID=485447 RepID=A0AAE9YV86_9GAMM|nr:hypothetical protein [Thalassomonas actiniarum]WDE00964.1 hypothetical protein SG35_010225 [Thalassomonas actiniarum]
MIQTTETKQDNTKKAAFSEQNLSWKVLANSPIASSRTDDIWFFDEQTGWLVNSSGYVCKTTDGGECWLPKFYVCPGSLGKPYLRCMGWGSEKVGWFGAVTGLGDDGVKNPDNYLNTLLHHTTDGGKTWQRVTNLPKAAPAGICGFYAVNDKVAYGSGTNDPGLPGPGVIKTTDGGASWELFEMSEHADNLIDIYFMDENNGFVVGGKIQPQCEINYAAYPPPRLIKYAQLKPVVLRTCDGGKHWENVAPDFSHFPCGEWGWKIQFINDKFGFISLENFAGAAILKTSDGGKSWRRHAVQDSCGNIINTDLEGIGFINENQGWVGGWGNNFAGLMNCYTQDGGLTWLSEDHNPLVSHSDDRLRINRYRFIGDPVTAGYCSGQQVYKLQFGCSTKKSAFAKSSAFAEQTRLEPAHSCEPSQKKAFSKRQSELALPEHDFDLAYKKHPDGKLEISYLLPEGAEKLFIGLWNQFAFYVKTLVNNQPQGKGRQSIFWDGCDDEGQAVGEGVYICRLSVDGRQGGSQMVEWSR